MIRDGQIIKTRLANLRVDEIALVDHGAGEGVQIQLWKRAAGAPRQGASMTMWERIKKALGITPKSGEVCKQRDIMNVSEEEIQEFLDGLNDRQKVVVMAIIEQAKKASEPDGDEAAPAAASAAAPAPAAKRDLPDDVKKALDDKVQLEKRLAAIEDERATERYTAIAKGLPFVAGVSTAELADMLKTTAKSNPTACAKMLKTMQSMNAFVEKSDMLKAIGTSSNAGEVSPLDRADQAAKARFSEIRKSNHTYTYEQAYRDVITENPDLLKGV